MQPVTMTLNANDNNLRAQTLVYQGNRLLGISVLITNLGPGDVVVTSYSPSTNPRIYAGRSMLVHPSTENNHVVVEADTGLREDLSKDPIKVPGDAIISVQYLQTPPSLAKL